MQKGADLEMQYLDVEEVEPDPEELEVLKAYESGDPEYQPAISQADLMKELGI